MISIRHSLEELDQLEEHKRLMLEGERAALERERLLLERQQMILQCCASAIRSTREYAVEIDPDLSASFRERLTRLESGLAHACDARDFESLQSTFRGELRQYRDRGQAVVNRLRADVVQVAGAMQAMTDAVTAHGAGYEIDLNQELGRLQTAAESDDLPAVRSTISNASAAIHQSFEQMQSNNQMVIVQLQDEIRGLHKAMDNERRVLYTDPATGAWNQRKVAERIDQLLKLDESFGLLVVAVVNWATLSKEHSAEVAGPCLKALATRLHQKFGAEGKVGRWSNDVFAVIVETDPDAAAKLVAGADQELSGVYPPGGPAGSGQPGLTLQIKSAFIGRKRGTDGSDFYPQIGQQVSALTE